MFQRVCIFSGSANPALAQEIANDLQVRLGESRIRTSRMETFCEIRENVRGVDTFVVQPTSSPVNENMMELLIMVDALRRASAGSITAVMPYYGYARQDRKVAPRTPISAKLCADLCHQWRQSSSHSTCMQVRSRASSTSRSTTSLRCPCCSTGIRDAGSITTPCSSRPMRVVSNVRVRISKRVDAGLCHY